MSVRARSKLGVAGIAALIIACTVAVFVLARSPGGKASGSPTQSINDVSGIFGAFGIAYGTTRSALAARFGEPDRKRDGCWIYIIRGGTFHEMKLLPQIGSMDAVRYCFFDAVVSLIEDHWRPGQKKSPAPVPWAPPLEFGCGGKPCQQT